MTNRKTTTDFPTSCRWSAYVTPKSPKWWLKKRFVCFWIKFNFKSREGAQTNILCQDCDFLQVKFWGGGAKMSTANTSAPMISRPQISCSLGDLSAPINLPNSEFHVPLVKGHRHFWVFSHFLHAGGYGDRVRRNRKQYRRGFFAERWNLNARVRVSSRSDCRGSYTCENRRKHRPSPNVFTMG